MGVIAVSVLSVIGLWSCQTPHHEQEERYVFVASNVNLSLTGKKLKAGFDGRGKSKWE